jgi:DNA-binding NtrC family response regulator
MISAQEREQRAAVSRPPSYQVGEVGATTVAAAPLLALPDYECFAGISQHVGELRRYVERQAQHQHAALLLGERGLRQEQVARVIHRLSERRSRPFVAVNAQTLSPDELDHLLSGPNGVLGNRTIGTIYLNDLIGLVPLLQQRLAIYLEEQRWRPADEAFGPRLILATEWRPGAMTAETRIAYGLIEMLRPQSFSLRPLRERREDIPLISAILIHRIARQYMRPVKEVTPGAMRLLAQYHWEYNIDELEGVLESVIAHLPPLEIEAKHLPSALRHITLKVIPSQGIELEETIDDFERRLIEVALTQTGGNQTRAAKLLGLRVQTLNAKIKRLAIDGRRRTA